MSSKPLEVKYPGARTSKETERLRRQHNLVKGSFGGLILCPADLSKPDLRVLDSGTADGYFLYDLRSELMHSSSAELIGTDIAEYPDIIGLPKNIKLYKQSILEDWPKEWEGTFDFVHQRACMSNAPTYEEGVKVLERLIKLVKPGGWIQIVDGAMPIGTIEETDMPSMRIFKTIGNFLKVVGMNPTAGKDAFDMLTRAGGLKAVDRKEVAAKLGRGAPSKELEATGYEEITGLLVSYLESCKLLPWVVLRGRAHVFCQEQNCQTRCVIADPPIFSREP
jgi:SAM-dependent methyltransferase